MRIGSILLLLFSIFALSRSKRRKCAEGTMSEGAIVSATMANYTKMLPESEESVKVHIEMHVQDMGSLNEISSDFEIDILFTQLWHDSALSFGHLPACKKNITMESRFLNQIWTPNTCLINSKKTMIHASPTDNIMFILYENGTVWVNHRLSVKAPCDLDLRRFPFDVQRCRIIFESYSHNSEEVELVWMDIPITFIHYIQLPDFDMVEFKVQKRNLLYPNGQWDQLEVEFTFKRRYGFYIIQAYVPTYLTIIVSWVSFCMEPKALPARTTVGISSLLALTFQFGNILKNLPRVSYVKAMDVWMLGCISFVFGTMLELAFVCYITRCQNSSRWGKRSERRPAVAATRSMRNGGVTNRRQLHLDDETTTIPMMNGNINGNGTVNGNGSCRDGTMTARSIHETEVTLARVLLIVLAGIAFPSKVIHPTSSPSPIHFHMSTFDSSTPLSIDQLHSNGVEISSHYHPHPSRSSPTPGCFMRFHPESVDKFSIVCFPLAFTLFNLIYWWHYLSKSFEENFTMPADAFHSPPPPS
ncbi:mod-1 [Pristionchus pacificus]|nr:mod-1 [Pristionchus pacificus]|eukprot:PDM74974.1 mod-1 [Pristionchus pacificus]